MSLASSQPHSSPSSALPEPHTQASHDPYPDFTRTSSPEKSYWDLEDIVPPAHEHRTLVLCFDGTGDQFDSDNSNVVHFFSMLQKDDPTEQLVYYQAGIGTYTIPQIAKPLMSKLHKTIDSMIGKHLNAHVMGGYEFLMQNYVAGDKICIFGFSRGAYTARALAGMIHKVGLLPRCNYQQVPFAYRMYSREDEQGWKQSTAFKKAFSIDVDIEIVGVWDTVGSVGFIPRRLPFTTSNNHVKYFRHALALDEHRARFHPNFWSRAAHEQVQRGVQRGTMPKSRPKSQLKERKSMKELERQYSEGGDFVTDVEEVWFAGCHCDVGGGAVKNEVRNSLARIPLRWMVRQCFLLKTGIMFHREALKLLGMDPTTLYPVLKPRPAQESIVSRPKGASEGSTQEARSRTVLINEEDEDLVDALCPTYDMLKISKMWWLLEVLPQKLKFQNDDDTWTKKHGINMGRPRHIPKQSNGVKVHRTVKLRMEAEDLKEGRYVPRPRWLVDPTWVD